MVTFTRPANRSFLVVVIVAVIVMYLMVTLFAITLLCLTCRVRARVPTQAFLRQLLSVFSDLAAFATMGTLQTG